MAKKPFLAVGVGALALLLLALAIGERALARENRNGARVVGLSASRSAIHASRQVQMRKTQAGDGGHSCRALISVDPYAAKTSRNKNGSRVVIGPHPIVEEAARTAWARQWQQYK